MTAPLFIIFYPMILPELAINHKEMETDLSKEPAFPVLSRSLGILETIE